MSVSVCMFALSTLRLTKFLLKNFTTTTTTALVRGGAGYSHQTFPWTICRSVCLSVRASVGLSHLVCPVHCGKTSDRIRMAFGIIGRTGPRMRQVVGFGDRVPAREGVLLGANFGARQRYTYNGKLIGNRMAYQMVATPVTLNDLD